MNMNIKTLREKLVDSEEHAAPEAVPPVAFQAEKALGIAMGIIGDFLSIDDWHDEEIAPASLIRRARDFIGETVNTGNILGDKKLTVIGKEWFDRTYGNSYVSVRVYDGTALLFALPLTYGYGSYYLQYATEELCRRYDDGEQIKKKHYTDIFAVYTLHERCLKREAEKWGEE